MAGCGAIEAGKARRGSGNDGVGLRLLPVQKIAEPATEVIGGNIEPVLKVPRLSARRPAQPVL